MLSGTGNAKEFMLLSAPGEIEVLPTDNILDFQSVFWTSVRSSSWAAGWIFIRLQISAVLGNFAVSSQILG